MPEFRARPFNDDDLKRLAVALHFSGEPQELLKLLPSLVQVEYAPGERIIREGEIGTDLFVLLRGSVSIQRTRWLFLSKEVARLQVGEFFGEIGFLVPTVRSASVVADQGCSAFRVISDDLKSLMERYPGMRGKLEEAARNRLFALASDT